MEVATGVVVALMGVGVVEVPVTLLLTAVFS